MPTDEFGNELGVNADGTTTFNGQTMAEFVASGSLPAGYYSDPEGTIRAQEGDFTGDRPNMGSTHGIAHYEGGKIVSFSGGGATPGPAGGVGGATPSAPFNPLAKAASAFDVGTTLKSGIDALVALASK